jgi:ABC-type multidrug transport system permease subunit
MLQNLAVYPTERDIFFEEFNDGCYGTATFVLSYTLLELPFTIVSSFIFGAVTAFVIELETTLSMFLVASFACFCIITCGESLGIIFCTLFSSYSGLPIHICSTFISFATIMGGILSLKVPMPLQAFNYLSPIKYMIACLATFSMHDRKFSCSAETEGCSTITGEEILALFKLNVSGQLNLIALGIVTIVYRLVAFGAVKASIHEWRMGTFGLKLHKKEAKDQVSLELGFVSGRENSGFVSVV